MEQRQHQAKSKHVGRFASLHPVDHRGGLDMKQLCTKNYHNVVQARRVDFYWTFLYPSAFLWLGQMPAVYTQFEKTNLSLTFIGSDHGQWLTPLRSVWAQQKFMAQPLWVDWNPSRLSPYTQQVLSSSLSCVLQTTVVLPGCLCSPHTASITACDCGGAMHERLLRIRL